MKVGFTILTYMNYKDTFDCVRTLVGSLNSYCLNSLQINIVLIDNASPNDAGDKLVAYCNSLQTPPWVDLKILQNSENQGYGYGNNIGLGYLFNKRDCDVVFVMNNDITVIKFDICRFLSEVNEKIGDVWGAHIINSKSNQTEYYGGAIFSYLLFKSRSLRTTNELAQNIEDKGLYISGAFIGFSRATYEIVGPFCEDFFLYFEEIEWFFRAHRKLGRKLNIVVLDGIRLNHTIGGSTGNAQIGYKKSSIAEYYSARARILFARKVGPCYIINAILFNLILAFHRILKGYFHNSGIILNATYRGVVGETGWKKSV